MQLSPDAYCEGEQERYAKRWSSSLGGRTVWKRTAGASACGHGNGDHGSGGRRCDRDRDHGRGGHGVCDWCDGVHSAPRELEIEIVWRLGSKF